MLQQLLMNREDFLKTVDEEEEEEDGGRAGGLWRPRLVGRTGRPGAGHQRPRANQSRAGRMGEAP